MSLDTWGKLSERHVDQAVAALEETGDDSYGPCDVLHNLEETLERISSEAAPP